MRRLFWTGPILVGVAGVVAFLVAIRAHSAGQLDNGKDLKTAVSLPVTRVVLFSSGVGHFSRSAEVEGDTRVDLSFPEEDVNDLIKSMTLRDFSEKGRVTAVSYDSSEPIERTLRSFAIDMNNNPSFAQVLVQARGEPVEVVMAQAAAGQPGTIQGKIMGVELQPIPGTPGASIEWLNLWCQEGVRSIKLKEVQRLRFSNPAIENETRRALETLARSHDAQKKTVTLHFAGEGKRKVEVGYVIENPVWKTSYRLVLDKDGKESPYLQGWAVVENMTDEDWHQVEMVLVSGRPLSFQMDLYNPLFVERPVVEPESYASLRPPTYAGPMVKNYDDRPSFNNGGGGFTSAPIGGAFGGASGVIGGFGGPGGVNQQNVAQLFNGNNAGQQGGMQGFGQNALNGLNGPLKRPRAIPQRVRDRNGALKLDDDSDMNHAHILDMKEAQDVNDWLLLAQTSGSAATASGLGDYFQYTIDQPVSLARQKTSLLPIVSKNVGGQRVSIYNPLVLAKHPLLGLKFKNTSGMNLSQGPITVYEGKTYAGDSRVLDMQRGEERLISYAIDQGTEVSMKNMPATEKITKVRAAKGIVIKDTLLREETTYDISNRSEKDRVLLIEYPNRKEQKYYFAGDSKPVEETASAYRFSVTVPAKKDLTYKIVEERKQETSVQLTNNNDDQIRYFVSLPEIGADLKAKLQEAMKEKGKWNAARREIGDVEQRIKTISDDQTRIRQNLHEVPKESEAYKTYLAKFDEQEKEMTSLHENLKKLQAQEAEIRKAYDQYLLSISAE